MLAGGEDPSRANVRSVDLDHILFFNGGLVKGYAHWGIENSLHWVLDVSMSEDKCQIYQNHAAENWAMLRQLSLNMLRAEPSKGSIPAKQKRAWMKTSFLEAVLSAGFSQLVEI